MSVPRPCAYLPLRLPVHHRRSFLVPLRARQWARCASAASEAHSRRPKQEPRVGTTTPAPPEAEEPGKKSKSPFYFEAGYALYAKRPSRPFPPPFLSPPSGSYSDPLTTHYQSRDRRPGVAKVNGEMIRGITNGDDAVLVSDNFIGANDGVGAWAKREKGHAALWSRLILHFWALEAEKDQYGESSDKPDTVGYLQRAYEHTKQATSEPTETSEADEKPEPKGWQGTTTAAGALITSDHENPPHPVVVVTQLGDGRVMVVRPRSKEVLFKTEEQWHWFDCPRQLGTNSPDTPENNAVTDLVVVEEDDVVLAMSDGVIDNLWDHEVVQNVVDSMEKWKNGEAEALLDQGVEPGDRTFADEMKFVAQELVKAARIIAEDPFAESPFMERGIEEGLSIEGGKLDDISVVAAQCKRRKV